MGSSEDKALDILKGAILLEKRGKSFYAMMAMESKDPEIREFFEGMSAEEDKHIAILSQQYRSYKENKKFVPVQDSDKGSSIDVDKILSGDVKGRLNAASSEAAAIAAAILMERNATQLYSDRANSAKDPEEKKLYRWLADWEQEHIDALFAIEQQLRESIWNDNDFWPM